MNRKKIAFLVVSLLMVYFVSGASLMNRTAAMSVDGVEQTSTKQCLSSPSQILPNDSILLSTSRSWLASSQSRVFEGCWTYFPQGPCRAIYRDQQNNYFICGLCDYYGNPGSGKCSSISIQTLNIGYWCS